MAARLHFLVKDLLDELRSERTELGTGALLRVQELLRRLPEDTDDDALLLALAPLLARSPQEQTLVYEKFRECQKRADEVFGQVPEPPPPEPSPIDQKIRSAKIWFWAAAAALALLLGALAWIYLRPEEKGIVEKSWAATAGQTMTICPAALPELDTFGQQVRAFEIEFPQTFETDIGLNKTNGQSEWAAFSIQNDTCFAYAARDSAQGMDSVVLQVVFSNGNTCQLRLRIFVAPPQAFEPIESIESIESIPAFEPIKHLPYDHTQAFLDLVVPDTDPWKTRLATHWPWLRWLLLGLLSALLFALWRWLEWRRRKLIAELDRPDQPPYFWDIRIEGAADGVVLGSAFQHALQAMRRRSATDTLRLDLPRSIQATAEKGGMPAFQFRAQTQPVDYLLLLDRQSAQNHRAQLFDTVFQALQAQELHIERFFYDSDLRVGYNESYPDGLRIADMAQRYAQARLLVVGTGMQLMHPARPRLDGWTEVFRNWPVRALFSPKPPEEWGRAERRLAELFTLLPATLQSLAFWAEESGQGDDARFERWREYVQDAPAAIFQPDDEQPLPMLLAQFPADVVRWVAACAIYPNLHWDLTLWLGRRLRLSRSSRPGKSTAAADDNPTLEQLLSLFRIRWFVQGQIPQSARAALLDWLEQDSPGLVARLRHALADLLEQSPPPKGSSAWPEHRMAVLLNQWAGETDPTKKKQQEKDIEKLLPQTEADFTVLRYLDRPPSPLHFQVPDRWKKYVYRGGFRALGFRASFWGSLGAALLWLLGALGLFLWAPAPPDEGCRGEKVDYVLDGKPLALCLDSPMDSLLWYERLALDTIRARDLAALDSIDGRMGRLLGMQPHGYPYQPNWALLIQPKLPERPPVPPDSMRQVLDNLSAALYNAAVELARRGQKDSACTFFQRGLVWDVAGSLEVYKPIADWCSAGPPPERKPLPGSVCRRVANGLAFRNRPLTQPEFDEISKNLNTRLDRSTRILTLPSGTEVELLDSNALNWTVRYKGATGFVAKYISDKPTLLPCGAPPEAGGVSAPLSPGRGAGGEALPDMVLVQGGAFTMGCTPEQGDDCASDEKPARQVTLSDFEMGKTEVTIGQYLAFCDETKTHYPEWLEPGNDYHIETGTDDYYKKRGMSRENKNHPVTGVSWNDAVAYCKWLSGKTGKKFRLPTEAEWEYAARGGQKAARQTKYAGSDNLNEVGWYTENTNDTGTRPVAGKKPNALGLYDMSGNVWEWCADWFGNYENSGKPDVNPKGPGTGSNRVGRGGSWVYDARYCRVSYRDGSTPDDRNGNLGFRLASSPQ